MYVAMKRGRQTELADKADISNAYVSQLLNGKRRHSWTMAKKLAVATNTKPELWLDGEPAKIKEILDAVNF